MQTPAGNLQGFLYMPEPPVSLNLTTLPTSAWARRPYRPFTSTVNRTPDAELSSITSQTKLRCFAMTIQSVDTTEGPHSHMLVVIAIEGQSEPRLKVYVRSWPVFPFPDLRSGNYSEGIERQVTARNASYMFF
jgi:hypothetical protein